MTPHRTILEVQFRTLRNFPLSRIFLTMITDFLSINFSGLRCLRLRIVMLFGTRVAYPT